MRKKLPFPSCIKFFSLTISMKRCVARYVVAIRSILACYFLQCLVFSWEYHWVYRDDAFKTKTLSRLGFAKMSEAVDTLAIDRACGGRSDPLPILSRLLFTDH